MQRTVGVLLGGEPGAGKTVTALSFTKDAPGPTIRVVTDMESRVWCYQAKGEDNAERLKYQLYYWPKPGRRFDAIELLELYDGLLKGEVPAWEYDLDSGEAKRIPVSPDVWVVDDVVLFQRQLERVLGKKEHASKIVEGLDILGFEMLLQYWKAPDPRWWSLVKAVIGELLLAARQSGVSVMATTEAGNMWADYGKSRTATSKGQRILGRTAKALLPWRQLLDAVWMLDRTVPSDNGQTGLKEKPSITMDLFNPKGSLVGIPPKFDWQDWPHFWQMLQQGDVPTDFSGIVQEERLPTPEELKEAEEAQKAVEEPVEDLALRRDAFLQAAVDELGFKSKKDVREALKELGFGAYSVEREPQIWAALKARPDLTSSVLAEST